jgi:sulfite exporter TauE/SafE
MTFALAVLIASLLGSVHCGAMCGAFTCLYASSPNQSESLGTTLAPHAAYNLGRLLAYSVLGVVAGAVGAGIDRAGTLAGVVRLAPALAASMMIVWGVHALLLSQGARVPVLRPSSRWRGLLSRMVAQVKSRPPVTRASVVGLASGLLPCGWLYAFVLTAAGSGSPVRGATLMMVFWLGTVPMMLAVGLGLQRLFGPMRSRLPTVAAAVITLLGILSLAGHFRVIPGADWLHKLTPAVPIEAAAARNVEPIVH